MLTSWKRIIVEIALCLADGCLQRSIILHQRWELAWRDEAGDRTWRWSQQNIFHPENFSPLHKHQSFLIFCVNLPTYYVYSGKMRIYPSVSIIFHAGAPVSRVCNYRVSQKKLGVTATITSSNSQFFLGHLVSW